MAMEAAATAATAAAASVWVKLYYDGDETPVEKANPIEIKPIPDDVSDLKKRVQEEATNILNVKVYNLRVYASGTVVPVTHARDIAANVSGSEAATGTSYEQPLIVVAPKYVQQHGELLYTIAASVHCLG
jgi:hypothetical protein